MSFHVIYMNYFCTVIYIIIIPYLGGGSQILGWMYARGGGGHSDAYCVQQGGLGGLKFGKKCVRN